MAAPRAVAAQGAPPLVEPDPGASRQRFWAVDDARLGGPGLVLLVPLVVLELALLFAPLVYLAFRSLYNWQPGGSSPFVGFGNYATLFGQASFWQVVTNELFYLLGLPLWVIAPLVVAYLLREHVPKAGVFRSIYFFPSVLSPAILGLVFRSLLDPGGPINGVLRDVGLGSLAASWLTDPSLVKPVIIFVVLWAGFGTGVLIFSAALAAVPQELFDAARIDGAGTWGELWHIAIPSIRSTIVLWTMFQVLAIFLFMFSWIYVLTGGGPGLDSTTMDFYIFQTFTQFGFFGMAAAQAVVLVIMVVICAAGIVVLPRLGMVVQGRRQRAARGSSR